MSGIEHRHLRSALEYAILITTEGLKRRPPLSVPKQLRAFAGGARLPSSALGRVRRAVEDDDEFRRAIAQGAVPELVDDVGRLWLVGGPDWETEAATLIDARRDESDERDLQRQLARAEKRRRAAEQATARIQAELMQNESALAEHTRLIDELRTDVAKAEDVAVELRTELTDTRNEIRHARDREAAAVRRAEATQHRLEESERSGTSPGGSSLDDRDHAGADDRLDAATIENAHRAHRRLGRAVEASREFLDHIESLLTPADPAAPEGRVDPDGRLVDGRQGRLAATTSPGRDRRVPVPLQGGVISTSAEAARHLVACGAVIIVDGYNVAMLAWPQRNLEQQRDALVARVENLARRHDADVTVVFDGSSVVGAHTTRRRGIRVVYSPAGTTADDVIRAEVDHLDASSPVVVVTNDREIVRDVKAAGANVVPSNAFIAVL